MGLHDERVTVLQVTLSSTPNADGAADRTVVPLVIDGCNVQSLAPTEDVAGIDPSIEKRRVSATAIYDTVRSRDRVVWRGREYGILGEPSTFYGALPHTEFIIYDTRG